LYIFGAQQDVTGQVKPISNLSSFREGENLCKEKWGRGGPSEGKRICHPYL